MTMFFRPYCKGGGKGKKSGKRSGSAAKANVAEEEVEEEEIEDDALLADKKKRKRKPPTKKKGKPQPAGSAAHEAEAAVDDDGFAYSAVSYPLEIVSSDQQWCLKGAKGIQEAVMLRRFDEGINAKRDVNTNHPGVQVQE